MLSNLDKDTAYEETSQLGIDNYCLLRLVLSLFSSYLNSYKKKMRFHDMVSARAGRNRWR